MKYVSTEDCYKFVFPYIYSQLSGSEPTAQYEQEPEGLNELAKVLQLVENDSYYPSFEGKAAYLLCSIAGSQYFTNGNKRLGIIVLMLFLIFNEVELLVLTVKEYRELLKDLFPLHIWENNSNIGEGEPLFLYNLAILIGDRNQWGEGMSFDTLKEKVANLFSILYRLQANS